MTLYDQTKMTELEHTSIVQRRTTSSNNVRDGSTTVTRKFSIGDFAFLWGSLGLCRGACYSKNWQKFNWFV